MIDRGTMPITRSNFEQTSFERKMRAYLAAHAAKQHERTFGWKAFRVLVATSGAYRMRSMIDALSRLNVRHSPGPAIFNFATRDGLFVHDPRTGSWQDDTGRERQLI
jgi:hypothetical protein